MKKIVNIQNNYINHKQWHNKHPTFIQQIKNEEATHLLGKEGISSSTTRTITEPPLSALDAGCSFSSSGNWNGKYHKIFG